MPNPLTAVAALAAALPVLSGCAGLFTAVAARPFQEEHYRTGENELVVLSMTGERRFALVRDRRSQLRVCAESLPDAAAAFGARSSANVSIPTTAGARSAGFEDQFAMGLLQTFNRTETADVVRQLGWQICQAYANEGLKDPQYIAMLTTLISSSMEVLKARANAAPAIAAGSVTVNPAPPAPKP